MCAGSYKMRQSRHASGLDPPRFYTPVSVTEQTITFFRDRRFYRLSA
jgi:hypothetical protein